MFPSPLYIYPPTLILVSHTCQPTFISLFLFSLCFQSTLIQGLSTIPWVPGFTYPIEPFILRLKIAYPSTIKGGKRMDRLTIFKSKLLKISWEGLVYYLLMLFCNLLFLFLLLLSVVIVLPGVLEAGDEVVEDTKELVALSDSRVLAEQATHSVELKYSIVSRQN